MDSSRFLIVGANGQLGQALQKQYPDAIAVDVDDLDITSKSSVENFDWSRVNVVLNAAAYTNVDGAETPEGRGLAWKVNAGAIKNLTYAFWKNQLKAFVHISTDYVFDGQQKEHDENENFAPLSVYGASKAAGDLLVSQIDKHYILRTSWVIGQGKNFVRTMLELGKKGVEPKVVNDQIGRLTFTSELVRAIDHLLNTEAEHGTYNVTNSGESVSWADVTEEIYKQANLNNKVTGINTAEYFKDKPEAAPRPHYSTLKLDKINATGFESKDWKDDLKDYLKREQK